jgi:hypothetical protein
MIEELQELDSKALNEVLKEANYYHNQREKPKETKEIKETK